MHARILATTVVTILAATASPAFAQGKSTMGFAQTVEKDQYHGFNVTLPIANLNGETIIHMEANLAGAATLALEGTFKPPYDEVKEKETAETGESRSSRAKGVSLLFSRYTRPMSMAGLYFSLGAGYREESVDWSVRPDPNDSAINLSLVDRENRLHHDADLTGTTGHFRFGYRYAAEEWPFVAGLYLGARHFQSGAKDGKDLKDGDDEATVPLAPMTEREKDRVRRLYATRPECGLEVGFRF